MRFITLIIVIIFISTTCRAATYFIDYSSGSDLKSGSSRDNAWQKCPGMVGFCGLYQHRPGDVFIFKGGEVWPAASLPLTIAYSGSYGNIDTYTTDHTWFSGLTWKQPTMDGQFRSHTILAGSGREYFKINDIRFVNAGALTANDVKGVEFSDCDNMELCFNTFAPESWGCLYIWTAQRKNFNNYLIHHNDISKCAFGIRVVPGGVSSIINNVQIYNNDIHDFHSQLSGEVHGDGIQYYNTPDVAASFDRYIEGFKIYNNRFYGDFSQVSGSGGAMTALIYLSGASRGVEIYNNLFTPQYSGSQSPNFFESFISLRDNPNRGGHHKIYNNTFVTPVAGGQVAAILEDDPGFPSPNLDIKNNIFSGFQWTYFLCSVNNTIDYNNVNSAKNIGKWGGAWVTMFCDWQKLGNDIHGINAEPQFASSTDFHLRSGSPCKDRGVILGEPYSYDKDGKKRPQGTTFDLGAFELPFQIEIIQNKPVNSNHATQGLGSDRIYTISGRLITQANTSRAAKNRVIVIVSEGADKSKVRHELVR